MKLFRKKPAKVFAIFTAFTILYNVVFPTVASALTSGPSQPEVEGFTPIEMTDMVDLFTGDFSYNIPLLDVGGYPLNISYNSGVTMDQEASWVGLGWNLNPGAITRQVRGIPDDFSGEGITKKYNVKNDRSAGVNFGASFELFGCEALGLAVDVGIGYSNYSGYKFEFGLAPSINASGKGDSGLTAELGIKGSSEEGASLQPTISYSKKMKEGSALQGLNAGIGLGYNSRQGLQKLTIDVGAQFGTKSKNKYLRRLVNAGNAYASGCGVVSFVTPSYIHQSAMNSTNLSFSFAATIGTEIFGAHGNFRLGGYYSEQFLTEKKRTNSAYGYLYENESCEKCLLDLNREKEGHFSKDKKYLPLTNNTYDLYSIVGQGIGGMFRAHKNGVVMMHDPLTRNIGSGDIDVSGIEIGAGNGAHGGAKIVVNIAGSKQGAWTKDDKNNAQKKFGAPTDGRKPVYIKQVGEKNPISNIDYFNEAGGSDPVRVKVEIKPYGGKALSKFEKLVAEGGSESYVDMPINNGFNQIAEADLPNKNQAITMLTVEEAENAGQILYRPGGYPNSDIPIFNKNDFILSSRVGFQPSNRLDRDRHGIKNKQISQVNVLSPEGSHYIYSLPVFNIVKREMTFAVQGSSTDYDKGKVLVKYDPLDITVDNKSGFDNYFDELRTPAYVHSYMLTGVFSSDYVDRLGDGPTTDDLGNFTKFNYSKLGGVNGVYRWRTPFQKDSASYKEGLKHYEYTTNKSDDKGNIIYGEKEVFYVHSIETKTHVAKFYTSDRHDGYGVVDINGGRDDSNPLRKLDKIELYLRKAKNNGVHELILQKTAHFEYDYSLCKGVPNNDNSEDLTENEYSNDGGKLTLKRIYFTYKKSYKGKLNSYKFRYTSNQNYAKKSTDRWGNYKPQNKKLRNDEYPYVVQDKDKYDTYASAWNLSSISLPSGGSINVEYEGDDYAYVQNKRAMQMFKVAGSLHESTDETPTNLLSGMVGSGITAVPSNYTYFVLDLDQPYPLSKEAELKDRFLGDEDYFYFKFLVNVGKNGTGQKEFVPGYFGIESIGLYTKGEVKEAYDQIYIGVKPVKIADKKDLNVNPVAKAGWNFIRKHLPKVVSNYGKEEKNDKDVSPANLKNLLGAIVDAFGSFSELFRDINTKLKNGGNCKVFEQNKSWVRLFSPNGTKLGGGSRVKTLSITDNWDAMSGQYKSSYGTAYDYTIRDLSTHEMVSSGVAAYEPILGGEENSLRVPVFTTQKLALVPDIQSYLEEPFGESFFPGATVGYRKVTVTDIVPQEVNLKRNGNGKSVHEFYTAKDYPVITRRTDAFSDASKNNNVRNFLKVQEINYMVASQGFVVELNDMHGKPKSKKIYQQGNNTPISGVSYKYKVTGDNRVSNSALVYDSKQDVAYNATMGLDYDVIVDMQASKSKSASIGGSGNLDAFMVAIIPITIPSLFPNVATSKKKFRSATVTKVINRYALLEETIATDLSSKVSTKNLAYDAKTGDVILTETTNQFDDKIYTLNYPAHWAYEGLDMAFKGKGNKFTNTAPASISSLSVGDKLIMSNVGNVQKAWVYSVNPLVLIDQDGADVAASTQYHSIIIDRPGHKNILTANMGTLSTLTDPRVDTNNDGVVDGINFNSFSNVISADAIRYTDETFVSCECSEYYNIGEDDLHNPFVVGSKNIYKPLAQYMFVGERTQTNDQSQTNIRTDGVFTDFAAFWRPHFTGIWQHHLQHWQNNAEMSKFNAESQGLEEKDPLGRFSAATYGYNAKLPQSVTKNAKYNEVGFDSFEDYELSNDCELEHFSFKKAIENTSGVEIIDTQSHTGKKSIKINPGVRVKVKKKLKSCKKRIDPIV